MKRALVLINPSARLAKDLANPLQCLQSTGFALLPATEKNPANFPQLIERFKSQIDLIIVGGGDGTVRSVLETVRGLDIPLGILPLGTSNNLARTLGIPGDLDQAAKVIADGNIRYCDLGLANGIPFLNVVGLGLSTQINRVISPELKRRWGPLGYFLQGLKIARRMKPFSVEIDCNGERVRVRSLQITICNGKHYGAGIRAAEDATITDGVLHLISTEVEKWWHGLLLLPRIYSGRYDPEAGVRLLKGSTIELRTHRPMSVDTDGEITTRTPLRIEVVPRAIPIFAPSLVGFELKSPQGSGREDARAQL